FTQAGTENLEQTLALWEYPASLLYEAAIKAGFEPVERHIGMMLSPFAEPGFDVSLAGASNDLRVYNALPFDRWVSVNPSRNEISLLGHSEEPWQAPQIEVTKEKFQPETMLLAVAGNEQN